MLETQTHTHIQYAYMYENIRIELQVISEIFIRAIDICDALCRYDSNATVLIVVFVGSILILVFLETL